MSVSRPAICIYAISSKPTLRPRLRCRNFHSSPKLAQRHRPRFASVKASDMGLVSRPPAEELFKPYSEEEKEKLAKKYTPAQIQAIAAGEEAIKAKDLNKQGVVRSDWGTLPYLDDFAQYRTTLDRRPPREVPIDPKARLTTEDEFGTAFVKWLDRIHKLEPPGLKPADDDYQEKARPNEADFYRINAEINATVTSKGIADPYPLSQFVPDPEPAESIVDQKKEDPADDEEANDPQDPDGIFKTLQKQTGMTIDDIKKIQTKVLVAHRVVNQTRLGKIPSIYCLAIAGNRDGLLGIGQAKAQEGRNAERLAKMFAIRHLKPIPRYEQRTIFGEVRGKVSAVEVELMSRPPGFGLRCQHLIFEMARIAGLEDLAARVPRSRNKMNTVKATFQALTNQRLPDDVARGRGKKMVDVRKVYYGGRV